MRMTLSAFAACSLLGLTAGHARAGIPISDLVRSPEIEVAQLSTPSVSSPGTGVPVTATPGVTAPNLAPGSTPLGTTGATTSLSNPITAGAQLTAGAQATGGANAVNAPPSSALPNTTEPVMPSPSSIAPQPTPSTAGFVPQSGAPTAGGLPNGSFTVAPSSEPAQTGVIVPPSAPLQNGGAPVGQSMSNGGSNANVPGWDHP